MTTGVGLPDARHRSVTFEPSRTITSLELSESSMFGGTIEKEREKIQYFYLGPKHSEDVFQGERKNSNQN